MSAKKQHLGLVAVVVRDGTGLLLAKASTQKQASRVGDQTGGRVFLFPYTDDFRRDYDELRTRDLLERRLPPSS